MSAGLEVKLTLPSNSWYASGPMSTSKASNTWPSGPQSAWVSSLSFDPGTWFRSLKLLGNVELTSHVAMSVLLSGAQSYTFVSPKLANLMEMTSPYLSLSSSTPSSARLMLLKASSPVFTPLLQNHCSHMGDHYGSHIPTFANLSAGLQKSATLNQTIMVVTAYGAGELLLPLPLEDQTTTSSFKACGSQMPISGTFISPLSSAGTCQQVWHPPLPLQVR